MWRAILVLLFIVGGIIGLVYVGGIFMLLLLAGVVMGIAMLVAPDQNTDPEHVTWVAKKRKESALELAFPFGGCAGLIGLLCGLGDAASSGSLLSGFLIAAAFAVVGCLIGAFLGYVFGN